MNVPDRNTPYLTWIAVVVLILAQACILGWSLRKKSPTADELNYLAAGVATWRTGDFRLFRNPPPDQSMLCAIPAVLFWKPVLPLESPAWSKGQWNGFGEGFARANPTIVLDLVRTGRYVAILLSCGVSLIVFLLTRRLFDIRVALMVLVFCVFDPNLAAHGRLVTTDIGATLGYLLFALACWSWLKSPTVQRLLLWSLVTGMACLLKHSGLLLVPCGVSILLFVLLRSKENVRQPIECAALYLAGIVVTIWIGYGCEIEDFQGHIFFPSPNYIAAVSSQWSQARTGQVTYFLGQLSTEPSILFYPVVFLIKTPIPTLILLLFGFIRFIRSRKEKETDILIVLPALVLLAVLLFVSRTAVGYRHLLPAFCLLLVVLGGTAARRLLLRGRVTQVLLGLMMVWLVGTNLFIHHYVKYLNMIFDGHPQTERLRHNRHSVRKSASPPRLMASQKVGKTDFNPLLHLPRSRGRKRTERVCSVFSPKPGGDSEGVDTSLPASRRLFASPPRLGEIQRGLQQLNLSTPPEPSPHCGHASVSFLGRETERSFDTASELGVAPAIETFVDYGPHYLAYFNELVGGPRNGHLYVVDSNLDWGQDLPLVKEYIERNPAEKIGLFYFGSGVLPELLDIQAVPISDWNKEKPTQLAISATALHGASSSGKLSLWPFFTDREPLAVLGYSIFVYETPERLFD